MALRCQWLSGGLLHWRCLWRWRWHWQYADRRGGARWASGPPWALQAPLAPWIWFPVRVLLVILQWSWVGVPVSSGQWGTGARCVDDVD